MIDSRESIKGASSDCGRCQPAAGNDAAESNRSDSNIGKTQLSHHYPGLRRFQAEDYFTGVSGIYGLTDPGQHQSDSHTAKYEPFFQEQREADGAVEEISLDRNRSQWKNQHQQQQDGDVHCFLVYVYWDSDREMPILPSGRVSTKRCGCLHYNEAHGAWHCDGRLESASPGGEIGRRKGLKILWEATPVWV